MRDEPKVISPTKFEVQFITYASKTIKTNVVVKVIGYNHLKPSLEQIWLPTDLSENCYRNSNYASYQFRVEFNIV